MAHPQIATFARLANGSAGAIRSISGQNTLIARNIHDIGIDPVRNEFVVAQTYIFALLTFKADADGNVPPLRTIMGPKTRLDAVGESIGRLALDTVNHEIYAPMGRYIVVFDQLANGDVAPKRVLEGPDTQIGASAVAVDPVNNLLMVSGRSPDWGTNRDRVGAADIVLDGTAGRRRALENGSIGQIAIFNRTASGNAKPLRVIRGSKTLLSTPQTIMTTYPPRGWIFGAVEGSEWGETAESSEASFVGVWSIHDHGDVPPHWMIGGPNGILRQARGVALDVKNKTVIISDKALNGVLSFEFPELF